MEDYLNIILTGDVDSAGPALNQFLEENNKLFKFEHLATSNLQQKLWSSLADYLRNSNAENLHVQVLNAIRILSREKQNLDSLLPKNLLDILLDCTGIRNAQFYENKEQYKIAVEGLKCMCNLIFNSNEVAAQCCTNGTLEGIIQRLRKSRERNNLDEICFFDMKILFIISALRVTIRPKLKEDLHGLAYLNETLERILNKSRPENNDEKHVLVDLEVNTVCEILKTLFNLTLRKNDVVFDEEEEANLDKMVEILQKYLGIYTSTPELKHELVNHIVNLLTNMPDFSYKKLYIPHSEERDVPKEKTFEQWNMEGLHEILECLKQKLIEATVISQQYESLAPVFTALLRMVNGDRQIRKYYRLQVLPPLKNVSQRPEEGDDLRNYICRLLTSPITEVRDLSAEFLFVLCKENVNRMIKYTGYGNAAGLFARRGLLGGRRADTSSYSSDSDNSDTEEYKDIKHGINPVLGCYEAPRPNPTADMTEEQKEYEAMKLVELMDHMTKAGVVKPCKIGSDGRPIAVDHLMELQVGMRDTQPANDSDSD